jgi:hypothetical protein
MNASGKQPGHEIEERASLFNRGYEVLYRGTSLIRNNLPP